MQIRSRITANPFVTILLLRSGHYGKSRREGEKKREGEEEEGCSRSGDKDLKEREGGTLSQTPRRNLIIVGHRCRGCFTSGVPLPAEASDRSFSSRIAGK